MLHILIAFRVGVHCQPHVRGADEEYGLGAHLVAHQDRVRVGAYCQSHARGTEEDGLAGQSTHVVAH
eukprot:7928988-Alexandrium_andersonii.AAC.1